MSLHSGKEEKGAAFDTVRQIIANHAGVDPEKITLETDLVEDLGITGDDGDDVLNALDKAFKIDWTGFDTGLVFGNEGCGLPPPWALKNNSVLYERQPCRVADLVQAAETGKWPILHESIPRKRSHQRGLYLLSAAHFILLSLIASAILLGVLMAIFRT